MFFSFLCFSPTSSEIYIAAIFFPHPIVNKWEIGGLGCFFGDSNRVTPRPTIPFIFADPIGIQTNGPQTNNPNHLLFLLPRKKICSKVLPNPLKNPSPKPGFFGNVPTVIPPGLKGLMFAFQPLQSSGYCYLGVPRFGLPKPPLGSPSSLSSLRWAIAQLAPALGLVAAGSAAGLGLGKAAAPQQKNRRRTRLNGGDVYTVYRSVV